MGIRVDEKALKEQLDKAGCPERANLPFQKAILNKELPYTTEAESDSHESVCSSSERLISVRYRAHCGLKRQLRHVRSMVFNCYNLYTILYCLLLVCINLVHYTN